MTLVELVEARYAQALMEIDKIINAGPLTPHQRYDYRKALKRNNGRPPKKYTAGLERMKHELMVERRQLLKGIQETLDYLSTYPNPDEPYLDAKWLEEVIGDVQSALNRSTTQTPETTD